MVKKLEHLEGCMAPASAIGLCFHRSVALCLDWPGARVVIGLLPSAIEEEREQDPRLSPCPFYHAWVEYRDFVWAPTTIERVGRLVPFEISDYYQTNDVQRTWTIRRPRILSLAEEHGWRNHLLTGRALKTDRPFADPLLDEAGIQWGMSDDNGVVPTQYATKEL